ncbi:carboxyl-terminal-processing peptidase 3, chloroplastic-like isoform X2 [Malus domestica]|uniref:carboxyl-terminal-processing peptidase 3, chloroplastic-like isoform X2 n=1 Tax=Malus domestica TaxID=3750 RepID=UPI0039761CB9
MEPLCRNLDLKPATFPPISPRFPKPISLSLRSPRFSCSDRQVTKKWRVSVGNANSEAKFSSQELVRAIGKGLLAFAAAAAANYAVVCCDYPAMAESLTLAFPVSRTTELNSVQRTLVETWGLIRETFVDPTFNHQDWDQKFQQTMTEMFPLKSADAAYMKISGMLSTLGDPFTRIISPKVVLSCVEGGPAARAGLHQGDELVEINGEKVDGIDIEVAIQKLRGRVGTTVTVKVHRGNDFAGDSSIKEVKLPREYIKLSPISTATIPHKTPDGRLTKMGYVKLLAFSQTAAADMENAINEMKSQGVHSYILDLRNNPGGLVKAGLDVAQIWLDGDETLVNTIDREGNLLPINMVNGHAITHDPLVVLVNEGSASASEILAGALHDNRRATLVGHRTFGKGKIQSVTVLHDGSALFVTVAKYLSPALHDIDQVGIAPDVQCTTEMLNSPKESTSKEKSSVSSSLEADSCVLVAEHELDIQESKGTAS